MAGLSSHVPMRTANGGSDIPAFTFWAYVKDNAGVLVWAAACIACLSFFLFVMGLKPGSIAFIALFVLSCIIAPLIVRYVISRSFWRDAAGVAESVDRIDLFDEFVSEPHTLEGRVMLGITETLAMKSAREVNALKEEIRSEREYSELWTHEVKAPIAASRLALENMHGETAAILKEQLERTESLVEQALYKSRMSSLATDYFIAETDLLACVREACKTNMRFLVARGVTLAFDIDEDMRVLADANWLRFIVSQLVLNAAKYDATTIRFSAREAEHEGTTSHTTLIVSDNGCGIPPHDVPRVFERGFTGTVGRAHGSATGMGLYLVAFMCARMGLAVTLASEEGTGTRVEITFPHDRRRLFEAAANVPPSHEM